MELTPNRCPLWCDVGDHEDAGITEHLSESIHVPLDGTRNRAKQISEKNTQVYLSQEPGEDIALNMLYCDEAVEQRITIPIADGSARYLVDAMAMMISRAAWETRGTQGP